MRQAFLGLCLLVFAHLVQLTSAIVVLKPFAREFSDLPAKFGNFPSFAICLRRKCRKSNLIFVFFFLGLKSALDFIIQISNFSVVLLNTYAKH